MRTRNMRTRGEIESCQDDPTFNNGTIRMVLEVLLDIRGLLISQKKGFFRK